MVRANILATVNHAEGIYNIGSGKSVTINQLAETILALVHKDLKPVYEESRLGDPKHTLADISKARNFDYKPKWTFEDGLMEVIKEFS